MEEIKLKNIYKKILSIACSVLVAGTMLPISNAHAFTLPELISIGLENVAKGSYSINITSTSLKIGTIKKDAFSPITTLSADSYFVATVATGSFIAIDETFSYSKASSVAQSLIEQEITAYVTCLGDDGFSVYVPNALEGVVAEASGYLAKTVQGFSGYTLKGKDDTMLIPVEANIVLQGNEDYNGFTINDKHYRGYLSFDIMGSGMTPVNTVDLEDYLYGVLPAEMYSTYHAEALKTQAVASRTYILCKDRIHSNGDYAFCDTTHCQVYSGTALESTATTNAVDATSGIVAVYDDELIEAVFSASSGGYTENSENVWVAVVPYLRAVPELYPENQVSWSRNITNEQLTALTQSKGNYIGDVVDLVITKLSTGGRIQELTIKGTEDTVVLTNENLRSYFSGSTTGTLPSKMFTINNIGGTIGNYGGNQTAPTPDSTSPSLPTPSNPDASKPDDSDSDSDTSKPDTTTPTTPTEPFKPTDTTTPVVYHPFIEAGIAGIVVKTEGSLAHLNGLILSVPLLGSSITKDPVKEEVNSYQEFLDSINPNGTTSNDNSVGRMIVAPPENPIYLASELLQTAVPIVSDFMIYETNLSTANDTGSYLLYGMGNGHGVGMSQKGAEAMAQQGYTYEQILKYYYTDITLETKK